MVIGLALIGPPTDGTAPEIRRARGFCNESLLTINCGYDTRLFRIRDAPPISKRWMVGEVGGGGGRDFG